MYTWVGGSCELNRVTLVPSSSHYSEHYQEHGAEAGVGVLAPVSVENYGLELVV